MTATAPPQQSPQTPGQDGFAGLSQAIGLSSNYQSVAAPVNQSAFQAGDVANYLTNQGAALGQAAQARAAPVIGQAQGGAYGAQMDAASAQNAQLRAGLQAAGSPLGGPNLAALGSAAGTQNADAMIRSQMAAGMGHASGQAGLSSAAGLGAGTAAGVNGIAQNSAMLGGLYGQQLANQTAGVNELAANSLQGAQGAGLLAQQQGALAAAQTAQNNGMTSYYDNAALQSAGAQQAGAEGYQQLMAGNYNAAQAANAGVASNAAQGGGKILGATAAMAMAASDVRLKTGIRFAGGTRSKL